MGKQPSQYKLDLFQFDLHVFFHENTTNFSTNELQIHVLV